MFKNVVKTEKRSFTTGNDGEVTTVETTETVQTSDGGTKTVTRTVTERSQAFSSSLKTFQDLNSGQNKLHSQPAALKASPTKKQEPAAAPVPAAAPAPAATGGSPSVGGLSKTTFQEDSLKWHNYYRQKHGVPPLKLSPTLCAFAQEWADKIAKTNSFQHRPNNKYGENIYMKGTSNSNYQVTGKEAVDSWYSEIKDHTFGVEPRSMGTGHFTQVIWKSSTELGIATAKSGGRHYVVGNYNPAGNFIGQYAANVPPLK